MNKKPKATQLVVETRNEQGIDLSIKSVRILEKEMYLLEENKKRFKLTTGCFDSKKKQP